MTLSNFDWTDKTSIRWFILLPTGHEGPYPFASIQARYSKGALSPQTKIWSQGLEGPITIKKALQLQAQAEEPPALPPLPFDDPTPIVVPESVPKADLIEIPAFFEEEVVGSESPQTQKKKRPVKSMLAMATLLLLAFLMHQWVKGHEQFSIRRHAKMEHQLKEKIESDFSFYGWDKDIFFKEYVPADLSHIWLVTAGFQACQVEASFVSLDGKLLSMDNEKVTFKTKGELKEHVAEFSSFNFGSGNRVIPGMYEMDVKAYDCHWGPLAAKLANLFRPVAKEYTAKVKVILYAKGPFEFNQVLDKLVKKKMEIELKEQGEEDVFWQNLQQKFQTLLAICLQIEQHFLDLLEKDEKKFKTNLGPFIELYTKKYGQFLTNFVVSNEAYFQEISKSGMKGIAAKRNYETQVRKVSKMIGGESIRIIEDLQSLKQPTRKDLARFEIKTKKAFSALKEEINQKIIQTSEDRSK